jgi:ornithine decarboxylase
MDPAAYKAAIERAADVIAKSKVKVDVVDVGGGFPAVYPGMTPPPLENFIDTIVAAAKPLVDQGAELWCEPGRAMVADGAKMLVRVTLRKGRRLYINDGTYGSLFDAGSLGWRYPVRLVRPKATVRAVAGKESAKEGANQGLSTRAPSEKLVPFVFYGPTCDSMDKMKGPFLLPEDTQEGDWIEIGALGAYGVAMQTRFNGFHAETVATVWPESGAVSVRPRRKVTMMAPVVTPVPANAPPEQLVQPVQMLAAPSPNLHEDDSVPALE